ncbi:LLM class flavin-dependent oxidoreductase [Corynebacterium halotolerans]|uniref:FMNH2-utilizing oxygenase n=1 Tax=Corynebacterium halotolerans YIM 70093 = DSM 44683 TaxID=1121362 RepID=M1P6F6_9CORY|nr:LLM class flavin-dependent oxidoreductase [Corynebacterium halotolerans]AGF72251.1 FMNH2-utilizing oxygenase [Corynebacterium halotolerans YIM 70093 = DSM 44683]
MTSSQQRPEYGRTLAQPFLALNLDGAGDHPAAREPEAGQAAAHSGRRLATRVQAAEAGGFQAITFADGALDARATTHPGRLAGIHAAAYAGPLTRRAALIPVADVVYTEPFHLATQLMSLDFVTRGRAGWIVYGTGEEIEARTVGREVADAARVKREVVDAIEVARRTWDSWEDDAEIRDVATGRFLDADKIHYVDFEGENYSVKGPSITPRPPQGQLPVLAPSDLVSAEAEVDGVLVAADSVDALLEAAATARDNGARIVIAEVAVALDARGRAAADRLATLDAETIWTPDTVLLSGTAAHVTSELARVLAAVDGVRLRPAEVDVDLPELVNLVLPGLRRKTGLAETPVDGSFRDLLGLTRPASRYTATTASKEN